MSMDINIIKKKILNLINASMNIRRKTYNALKHIVNRLNDGTYYVNINFNVCLHNNNLFHIYTYIKWTMKKTGVLFTISSVNFELKQGKEYRAEYILRILRLSLSPSLSLSLSSPLQSCCCSHLNRSVLFFNSKLVIILFPFFINLI